MRFYAVIFGAVIFVLRSIGACPSPQHGFLVRVNTSRIVNGSTVFGPGFLYNDQDNSGPSQISTNRTVSFAGARGSVTAEARFTPRRYQGTASTSANFATNALAEPLVMITYAVQIDAPTKYTVDLTATGTGVTEASLAGPGVAVWVKADGRRSGTLPEYLHPGVWRLTAYCEHPNTTTQYGTGSASFDLQLDEAPTTDLSLTHPQLVRDPDLQNTFAIKLSVSNPGFPTKEPNHLKAYWADGPLLADKLTNVPAAYATNIPVDFCGSMEVEIPWSVIMGRPTGVNYLVIVVDEDDQIHEKPAGAESNNVTRVNLGNLFLRLHSFRSVSPAATAASTGDGIDDPLVPPLDTSVLVAQKHVSAGLVADGVTPLVGIAHFFGDAPQTFHLSAVVEGAEVPITFSVLEEGGWKVSDELRTFGNLPFAYYYIMPVRADDLRLAPGRATADVSVIITPIRASPGVSVTNRFRIRKPPIVLVHGFRSDRNAWGPAFISAVSADRGNFWKAIEYGVNISDKTVNTFGRLPDLALQLSLQLRLEIEQSSAEWRNDWAFTRYDVIGHSQGGILSRMLSSRSSNGAVPAFRSADNGYRGRFHRVVTIGSPHNGSTLLRYLLGMSLNDEAAIELTADIVDELLQGATNLPVAVYKFASNLPHIIPTALIGPGILQPKFDPFGEQINDINREGSRWAPDSDARFHLLRTAVGGGRPPLLSDPVSWAPLWVFINLLPEGRGTVVLPRGSDAVVDLDSQGAVNPGESPMGNVSTLDPVASPTAHADNPPLVLVGATDAQTLSPQVARRALAVFNGDPAFPTGPFPSVRPLDTVIKTNIDNLGFGPVTVDRNIRLLETGSADVVSKGAGTISGSVIASLEMGQLSGEPMEGSPVWFVQGFGSQGEFTAGLSLISDPDNSRRVTVVAGDDVSGDIVVYGNYRSFSGRLIVSLPFLVATRGTPGVTLIGIDLKPSALRLETGAFVQPEVWGKMSDGTSRRLFVGFFEAKFRTSDPGVVSADADQMIRAVARGQALIDVEFRGFSASSLITVDQPVENRLRLASRSGDELQFTLFGEPGRRWNVEASPDLATWTSIIRLTNSTGFTSFSDSGNGRGKFYRAVEIP